MASGSAGEGAGSNTDQKTSKVNIMTPPVFATSREHVTGPGDEREQKYRLIAGGSARTEIGYCFR